VFTQRTIRHTEEASLAWRQGTAETTNLTSLVGQNANEFETVEESHAMANDSAQNLKLGHFGDGKLKRNHFPWAKLAGYHCSQPVLGDFKAATVNTEISFLPQDLDDQRQFGAVAGVTSCRGLVHAFDFLQFVFYCLVLRRGTVQRRTPYRHKNLAPWQGLDTGKQGTKGAVFRDTKAQVSATGQERKVYFARADP
jgi:hypothetical protein